MISVITPVYNGERFIESCIQAVITQACPNVEHIIVDGGSKDGTVNIIKRYAEQYAHIRWVSEKDKGQSDAMNKGIALAEGEILAFLNVDDYYEPNVLNRVASLFNSLPEPSLLVGNCNLWDNDNNLIWVNKPRRLNLSDLLLGMRVNPFPVNPSAYFYHKSLHQKIGLYDVNEKYAMDLDFILKAVQAATVKYVDETWGNFRMLEGTKTVSDQQDGNIRKRVESLLMAYRKDLSPLQRWQVAIGYEFYKNWHRLKYLLTEPHHALPVLGNKLKKVWSSAS